MTNSSVKGVGFGQGGLLPVQTGTQGADRLQNGGFQSVWNDHTEKQTDGSQSKEDCRTVRTAPGDSLRARDEHLARTKNWEPNRNVEERADIPEEDLEEAMEVLCTAASGLLQQLAQQLGKSAEELQDVMQEMGMELTEVLDPEQLTGLFLELSGADNATELLTDEGLYESFQELMGQLEETLTQSAESLDMEPEQLKGLLLRAAEKQPQGLQENSGKPVLSEENEGAPKTSKPESFGEQKTVDAVGGKQETGETQEETAGESEEQTRNAEHTAVQRETRGEDRQETALPFQEQQEPLNALTENAASPVSYGAESVWDADTQNIMRQIMDYMKLNPDPELSSVEMQLHPENLGTLQIQVAAKGGAVTANFITQNETVKAVLESQMIQLQQQFEEQGVRVDAIEVTVQTHQFEQNLEQGRGSSQEQEPAKKPRIRRISLDGDAVTEADEEELLTAELMRANGNTVDYTA